jgi:hypothetical protein
MMGILAAATRFVERMAFSAQFLVALQAVVH